MSQDNKTFKQQAYAIGQALIAKGWLLATAESCTGGGLAEVMTANAGSSQWFDSGFVTYSNHAKQHLLGVQATTLTQHGAVSEATASEMAQGALTHSQAQVALATTGIAGPTGGSPQKPVGMVCFAVACKVGNINTHTMQFTGDRNGVRIQAIKYALELLQQTLSISPTSV